MDKTGTDTEMFQNEKVVAVQGLYKEFKKAESKQDQGGRGCKKGTDDENIKVAVNNLSFGGDSGQVFGPSWP